MRKLLLPFILLLLPVISYGQEEFTDEYLDTVNVARKVTINDYWSVGANYGITFSQQVFNPRVGSQEWPSTWNNFSIMFTKYGKMFGYMPYFGLEFGFEYGHQGFRFKQDPDVDYKVALPFGTVDNISYITEERIEVIKVPVRSKFHVDISVLRLMACLGFYGGWRLSVTRDGDINDESIRNNFASFENKFDYGMEGGAGFAFLFDPIEVHFNVIAGWSWSSLYKPDTTPSVYSSYYYRYANPLDIMVTAGIHFQLTKRTGKTNRVLKREAKEIIFNSDKNEDTTSQDR